jgi:hypothetical protein
MPSLDDCPQTAPPTPSRAAGLPRNRWLVCVGITGWIRSECPAALRRNAHLEKLVGMRMASFALSRQAPPGKWGTATYALQNLSETEKHRGHGGHKADNTSASASSGTSNANGPPPLAPMPPMPLSNSDELVDEVVL